MIGVISKPDQAAFVEEFFELFKTPWEFYRQDRPYDVVLATTDYIPEVDAKLLVVYGSEVKSGDAPIGIDVDARHRGVSLNYQGTSLPIYGPLVTFKDGNTGANALVKASVGTAGVRFGSARRVAIRLGYDLFDEVGLLISAGQPVEHAQIPTLEIHIAMLRGWILSAGLPLLEIPPSPSGHGFAVCLTHDIDFVGIRRHKFDHSMWGFVYRSTLGALRDVFRRRISFARLLQRWHALASLPFVYIGWAKDFWDPFEWYLRAERNLPATYFFIPFKGRAGQNVPGRHASRRATAYDVGDLPEWTATLAKEGHELGVHGIDAWHSVAKGSEELARVGRVTGTSSTGIRMHWLLCNEHTASVLEKAGYSYDSTAGYNETVGYRNGTGQVFRPAGATSLLELPLHIQDGALFYPQRLDLSESEAEERCDALMTNARKFGGVLTVLWHDRSHGPERFWGDFYEKLLRRLKSDHPWFGTAGQVVGWFRKRREVRFVRVETAGGVRTFPRYDGDEIMPPLIVRLYGRRAEESDRESSSGTTSKVVDVAWNGKAPELSDELFAGPCAIRGRAPFLDQHKQASPSTT